jgi:23S rRNA G2445 N2-methylase RlmL
VRRAAVNAAAKIGGDDLEQSLRAMLEKNPPIDLSRAIASALGKIGGSEALEAVSKIETSDGELARIVGEARTKIGRTIGRGAESAIDATRTVRSATPVVFHCRAGLEEILRDEIDPSLSPRIARTGAVEATLVGSMTRLRAPRVALRFTFPLRATPDKTAEAALVEAMTSDAALDLLRTFTRGAIRYRIEWSGAGHRRATTFRAAAAIARARPELVNDPTSSPWEAIVVETKRGAFVELWPRGLHDDRFEWRVAEVQGASHPTIAAALARVAEVRADDVVWDPFCGAGAELVERARLGPVHALFGTDVDTEAIERARANLAAFGAEAILAVADARTHRLATAPTLAVSNPPMGRRVLPGGVIDDLLVATLRNVSAQLAPPARIVWISPAADRTAAVAVELGLRVSLRRRVDLGGFSAEIQRFDRGMLAP